MSEMHRAMRSGAPRPTVLGRPFEPLLLGLTLTMVIVALANWQASDRGTQYPLSVIVAIAASVAAVMLVIGWCCKTRRLVEYGLLAVVLAYSTRAWFILISNDGIDNAVWFSLATVIMAGGAYFLEANDRRYARGRRE
jgi:xanthine/uracil permease